MQAIESGHCAADELCRSPPSSLASSRASSSAAIDGLEGVVDLLADVQQSGRAVPRQIVDHGRVAGLAKLGLQRWPVFLGHERVGEAGVDRVAGSHAVAGEAEILAERPGAWASR